SSIGNSISGVNGCSANFTKSLIDSLSLKAVLPYLSSILCHHSIVLVPYLILSIKLFFDFFQHNSQLPNLPCISNLKSCLSHHRFKSKFPIGVSKSVSKGNILVLSFLASANVIRFGISSLR